MISLPNGCRCSQISVSPSNWNKSGASVQKNWRIHYRFYDPSQSKPYQVIIKAGINHIKDLEERRFTVKKLIEYEYEKLKEGGYNPIVKVLTAEPEYHYEIDPETPLIEALRLSLKKLSISPETREDIHYIINGLEKAASQIQMASFPISKISRKHIKMILEHCGRINKNWSANRFNVYRAYLLMLFKELVELEVVQANSVRDISKMKTFKKLKPVLSETQRETINKHLQANDYRFWLFVNLFFHSGARITEITQIRCKDVNLKEQFYTTIIRKGREYREVRRTIKTIALPFWEEFLKDCQKDQYIFGVDFLPADKAMIPDTITRRWQKVVKKGLGIQIDFYSLKHLNTSEIVDQMGDKAAAEQNGHLSTLMVNTIYDVKKDLRQHQQLKEAKNSFA
jgi:integrase